MEGNDGAVEGSCLSEAATLLRKLERIFNRCHTGRGCYRMILMLRGDAAGSVEAIKNRN